MPIYMDRHDVLESVTAEQVAQLHQEDLKIQDRFGCRGLTYWFDDKRKTAFCLIEAPDEQALRDMHNQAHGQVPHSIIEVEAGVVESFLGRIEDPSKKQTSTLNIIDDPAFRMIMVIAIETSFTKQNTFHPFAAFVKEHHDTVRHLVTNYKGRLVREMMGHFLISFETVSEGLNAALDIKAKWRELKSENTCVKIGISTGVPVTEKKSIFEDSINLAQWICDMIPGEIVVTAEVAELSGNINAFNKTGNIITLTADDEKFITRLMGFIDTNWSNSNLKVDDFSKPASVSKSQLYRKLKTLTGKSPNTFLKDYRLKKALGLLNRHTANVSEIAFETGFTSPSYFSKCFQKKYGYTPSGHLSAKA